MPQSAPLVKVESVRRYNAKVILHGQIFDDAYNHALELSREFGYRFVPGFDSPAIVAGQATAGFEILEQLSKVTTIVVPVGGGGLISGIALAAHFVKPSVRIVGVQSEWIVAQRASGHTSQLVKPISIADGIAVKKIGQLNGAIIRDYVHEMVAVSEDAIADSVMRLLEFERTVVEGAGAAALAAILSRRIKFAPDEEVAVLACGSNIDLNLLSRLIERDMAENKRLLHISVSAPDRPGSLHALTGLIAAHRANVLQVGHDRSFSRIPGNVTMTFLLEVRDFNHRTAILEALKAASLDTVEI